MTLCSKISTRLINNINKQYMKTSQVSKKQNIPNNKMHHNVNKISTENDKNSPFRLSVALSDVNNAGKQKNRAI